MRINVSEARLHLSETKRNIHEGSKILLFVPPRSFRDTNYPELQVKSWNKETLVRLQEAMR